MTDAEISQAEIDKLNERLGMEAEASGYHLNPDVEFTKNLVKSLIVNEKRYGYWACDYRDPDLNDYDACYYALYVSGAALKGERKIGSIPERRPPPEKRGKRKAKFRSVAPLKVSQPVWRCKVCGYLCARGQPPEVCPVCKAKRDRFERFM
jgi:ferredoxin-thioredoxin reductase catalytic subunit/rubredoxin